MLVCGTMKSLFDFGDLDLIFKVHQHSELSNFEKKIGFLHVIYLIELRHSS